MTSLPVEQPGAEKTVARALFLLGMILMPVSTGPRLGVFSLGLPFIGLAALHYIFLQVAHPAMDPWTRRISLHGFLLITAIGIASVYAISPFASFARFVPNALGFFVFLLLISPFFGVRGSHSTYEFTARVFVAAGALVAFYYLANFAFAVSTLGVALVLLDRVTGGVISLPWGATNVIASVLLFPLFLTFYFTNGESNRSRRFPYLLARVLMLAAIAATVSRGAILSTAIGMIVLTFFFQGRARRRLIVFIAAAAIVLIYVNFKLNEVMSQQAVSSLLNRFQDSDMKDLNGRVELWSLFGAAFVESPFLGIGYYSSLYYFQTSGHNLLLTSIVERGIIGFGLSAALPIYAARSLITSLVAAPDARTKRILACLFAGGLASMLHLMIEDANFTQQYIVYSWVALALVFQAARAVSEFNSVTAPSATLTLRFE